LLRRSRAWAPRLRSFRLLITFKTPASLGLLRFWSWPRCLPQADRSGPVALRMCVYRPRFAPLLNIRTCMFCQVMRREASPLFLCAQDSAVVHLYLSASPAHSVPCVGNWNSTRESCSRAPVHAKVSKNRASSRIRMHAGRRGDARQTPDTSSHASNKGARGDSTGTRSTANAMIHASELLVSARPGRALQRRDPA